MSNPLVFACLQVSNRTSSMRSNCLCLVVVPCPHKVLSVVAECLDVIRQLLLLCGDVELNPGPTYTLEEKVSMILDGQKDQTRTLNDIKRDQRSLQKSVNENTENFKSLDVRMIRLESAIHKATELEAVVRDLTKTVQLLVRKVDDLENRSRRNNLIIFGLNEAENETALELTQTVQANVFQRVNVNPESIERIHRLGKKRRSPRPTVASSKFKKMPLGLRKR
ncbi:uncharacterized protein LOC121833623 [Ixodes scapularis]|uniref:uncharacterized protein LOC121833623 n=1 Tax=Ixodes scapularis TaxID=6945 RepID=UPI001C38789F|nr:uncharacterized protein LOC121833623 [Ixodes scapularis]